MSHCRIFWLLALLTLAAFSGCLAPRLPDLAGRAGKGADPLGGTAPHVEVPTASKLLEQPTELPAELPPSGPGRPNVSTVLAPEGQTREISLAECIAVAVENGRTGAFLDQAGAPGPTSAAGVLGSRPVRNATDRIRVIAYDPAAVGTQIEKAMSRFDVIWQSSMIWDKYDRPSIVNADNLLGTPGFNNSNVQNLFSSLGLFANFNQADVAQFRSSLLKPLATGGVAGITFRTDWYSVPNTVNLSSPFTNPVNFNVPLVFSPAYRPAIDLTFEQPLLRGGGVFINQVREQHPGALRTPFAPVGAGVGILLARITYEQSKLEFERQVHLLLFRVEEAYWDLYSAYWVLYSREVGMREAQAAWEAAKVRYDRGALPLRELAELEEQYQALRIQRLEALGRGSPGRVGVLEAERRLRYVLGMPPEDGTRLVPSDVPTDAPALPEWDAALADARTHRPELQQVQQEIKAAELGLAKAKDLRLPDLRFISKYNLNGQGHSLSSGLDSLATNQFNDWELGLLAQVVLGAREGNAEVTRAKLEIAQRFAFLRDQEDKIVGALQRSYRDVVQFVEEMRLRQHLRETAAVQLRERTREFKTGRLPSEVLLQAQRKWVDALRDENIAVCNYNIALADFERQRGTIPQYENVVVSDGPLPPHAQERASEHIRERQRACVLRERPLPPPPQAEGACADAGGPPTPEAAAEVTRAPLRQLFAQTRDLPADLHAAGRRSSPYQPTAVFQHIQEGAGPPPGQKEGRDAKMAGAEPDLGGVKLLPPGLGPASTGDSVPSAPPRRPQEGGVMVLPALETERAVVPLQVRLDSSKASN